MVFTQPHLFIIKKWISGIAIYIEEPFVVYFLVREGGRRAHASRAFKPRGTTQPAGEGGRIVLLGNFFC